MKNFYKNKIKRLLDLLLSLIGLVLFGWLLLIIALLVKINLGSPVIFKQPRPGKDEKLFYLYKFRTMTDEKDPNDNLLSDDLRLTNFGRRLRKTSLDELPEILNILKGDMSIVGPRPLLVEYLPYYKDHERRRHEVRPGLTGWAQVNGRNATSWSERFEQDLYYIENVSLWLDLKILCLTVARVLKATDVLVGEEIPSGRLDDVRRAEE